MLNRAHMIVMIVGGIALLVAMLVIVRIWLPTLAFLPFFFSYTPFQRVVIIIKLLSPLLCFLLVVGWGWIFWMLALSIRANKEQQAATNADTRSHTNSAHREAQVIPEHIAVPPNLQNDPGNPVHLPTMPPLPSPLTPPPGNKAEHDNKQTEQQAEDQAKGQAQDRRRDEKVPEAGSETGSETGSEAVPEAIPGPDIAPSTSRQNQEDAQTEQPAQPMFSLQSPETHVQTIPPVTLSMLKQIRCFLRADDGSSVEVRLRLGENAIRLIVLAYIAWKQGQQVDRDKLLTHVIARGKRQDMTTTQLSEVFDAAKMYLRQDLDRARKELVQQGHAVSTTFDFFGYESGFYYLPPSCHVTDLEWIDECYATIEAARKEGVLDEKSRGPLPEWVISACSSLIEAYSGDFLKDLLDKYPDEFGSWVKEPVTLYRDKYLAALLLLARHESALANAEESAEQESQECRQHRERAAQRFFDYAMYALNTRWDRKVKFAHRDQSGKDGERVVRAERALRRCIVELGKLGHSDAIDQAYITFKERMLALSEGNWQPNPDTERDVAAAKQTATGEYRFPSLHSLSQ